VGHLRGGLAAATILACAGFAALSGSSIASAATMGKVALPEMERYRYSPKLATGSIAAGGTLGILIPPSVTMIVYGIATETSIGRLFLSGVLPGLLLVTLFMIWSVYHTYRTGSAEVLAELLEAEPADLLLCNILAPVIEALAPAFTSLLAPSGVGLLSGLLVPQAARLQQVLANLGWQADLAAQQSQWGLLMLHKAR
jgi:TRAP-type C4-dicarboxylate transport system permease large subunit